MKIQVSENCLTIEPENQSETHFLEHIEKSLERNNLSFSVDRQWEILSIKVFCEKGGRKPHSREFVQDGD